MCFLFLHVIKEIHSPVQKLDIDPFTNLYVKRDDLIDPYISGNKWRKLKYIHEKAISCNKNHLVTFGGAYSNHLVATAAAAARSGLQSTAFVRGEEVKNEMLLLCTLFGMKLIFTDRTSYKDKKALFEQYFSQDEKAFFIDEGGASAEAVNGCAEIINELTETYDHIFVAAGTGTTAAGLLQSIQIHNIASKLHVISALKGDFITNEIAKYTSITHQLVVHNDYHFGGYAKTTVELIEFIKQFSSTTGLLIDPVYTAKMCYAIVDLEKKGAIKSSNNILAIHTGGLMGILGMKERLW